MLSDENAWRVGCATQFFTKLLIFRENIVILHRLLMSSKTFCYV